ncbi:MAG: hypothetical protein GQF41_2310 [Candidatus Rifleibacterium amylolyticum]|nr:MAG: hypothetical protein GQF41_2310 [Candidatus Rifleibacterium amylolyticum]
MLNPGIFVIFVSSQKKNRGNPRFLLLFSGSHFVANSFAETKSCAQLVVVLWLKC